MKASLRMAYEVKDRYRTSVTALSGLAQAEATLIFCLRPVYRWQHRLTQRNPTGTEPKVRLEKQCERKRGSEIQRSKIKAANPNSRKCTMRRSAIPFCLSISHRATLSRRPCGSLCSAVTGTRRDATNLFLDEGMAGFDRTEALLSFSLDTGRPSHGRVRKPCRTEGGPAERMEFLSHQIRTSAHDRRCGPRSTSNSLALP
jgi:hypothetical protein